MTAALGNTAQGTPFSTGVDAFVYPQFIGYALRAPTTQDIYNPGTRWQNNAVNPAVQYYTTGAGLWYELPVTGFGVSSVAGTANQTAVSPTTGAVVVSLVASPIVSGTMTAATGFVATTAGAGLTLNSGTASGTTTATLNGRSGQITITTPTINAGATFTMTITNSSITASTTQVLYGLTGGTTGSAITIQSVTNSAGQSVVVVQNASAVTNSTGSLVLTFLVLN